MKDNKPINQGDLDYNLRNKCLAIRDPRLESLSDKVRMGIPIDFCDVIEVIEYQERLRIEVEANHCGGWFRKLLKWMKCNM